MDDFLRPIIERLFVIIERESMNEVKKHLDAALAALSDATACAAASAEDLFRRERSRACNVEHVVDNQILGSSGYDPRAHLNAIAGEQMGRHLAEKIDFLVDVTHSDGPFQSLAAFRRLHTRFRATIFAYTESELRALIERAHRAGAAGR